MELQGQGSKKNSEAEAKGKSFRWHGKKPPKSRRAVAPEFVEPELATLDTHVPAGSGWLHEIKYDGYRIIGRKAGDETTLFSRSGLDWTVRFPAIAPALGTLPCHDALIDGEIAFVLPSGITDFKSLQEHIDTPNPAIRYYVFDLLELDGKDLRRLPLSTRKDKLKSLMSGKRVSDWLIYSEHFVGDGPAVYQGACGAGLEGIISKRADSKYRSGRFKDWLKIKCKRGEEFVIGGYSRSDVKGKPFSSLLLGSYEDGALKFAGKVGTGFDTATMTMLAKRFKPLERATPPFIDVPAIEKKGARWLEPKLVCAVNFAERTPDGRLRHPSFQGLREDKAAREVRLEESESEGIEMTRAKKRDGDPTFHGITLSNPDKVYYPGARVTKLDVAEYYDIVAPFMLPYLVKRPISLVRCPDGIDGQRFFQRHAMKGMSEAIKEIPIPGGETKKPYLYIDGEKGLFGLVQIGTLEIHDWGVSIRTCEPTRPHRVRSRSRRGSRSCAS